MEITVKLNLTSALLVATILSDELFLLMGSGHSGDYLQLVNDVRLEILNQIVAISKNDSNQNNATNNP